MYMILVYNGNFQITESPENYVQGDLFFSEHFKLL